MTARQREQNAPQCICTAPPLLPSEAILKQQFAAAGRSFISTRSNCLAAGLMPMTAQQEVHK